MLLNIPGLAVIGSGYWGKNLVRNFHELKALRLICDKNETLLAQFQSQYQDVETCFALNDVLSREDIIGVVIATPAETHFTVAREALLAGKHVLVEKPMALNEEEGQELIVLAEKKNRIFMVGHLLQYHPAFMHLREIAATGGLGRINYIYSHRLNLGKIRREENILWSFAPHDISMILSLAGEDPESVLTTGGNYLHQRIADVTTTHLEFASGLRAHIFVSWLHPFKEQKLVVVGDRKMAVFDDTQPWPDKLLLYPHEIKWQNNMPVPTKAEPERIEIENAEPLRMECEHFLNCISCGHPARTDALEGLRVLRILNASQRSLDDYGAKICLKTNAEVQPRSNGLSTNGYRPANAALSPYDTNHSPTATTSRPPLPGSRELAVVPACLIHPTAVVDEGVTIGGETRIWHFSHIMPGSSIGEHCSIGQNVVIGPDATIGNGCKIQNNVSVYKGVTLENDVFCGPSMVFTNVLNPRAHIRRMDELRSTLIRRGATLGANCTIVCGCTIGRYAFVGAGAVVTKDVPDHALVVGNPARRIGWMCECGEKLDPDLKCPKCAKSPLF